MFSEGEDMKKIRIVATGATITSILCTALAVAANSQGRPMETRVLTTVAIATGASVLPTYCIGLAIRALHDTTLEIRDLVSRENHALHRSMVVTMEEYGDVRAVDAIVANERRRVLNERGHDTVELRSVGGANMGNVTAFRKR